MNSDDIVDLGEEHHKAGRLQEAEACYRKALEIDPGHPGALFYLANLTFLDGRVDVAKQLLEELLREEPNDAEALHLLGMIALKEDDLPGAKTYFEKAVALQPAYVQAHYTLGIVLYGMGKLEEALASHRRAMALNPQLSGVHVAIGDILRDQNRLDESLDNYRQAIAVDYNDARAHVKAGLVHMLKQQNAAAKASFQQAIALDPTDTLAYRNLGLVQIALNEIDDGIATLRKSVELKPQDSDLRINLALSLMGIGKLDEAIACLEKSIEEIPDNAAGYSILLCLQHYRPDISREKTFADHMKFGELFETPLRANWPARSASAHPHKRLRVGFVSADLCSHPVGFFLEGILRELYQKNEIDIYLYGMNAVVDAVTDRLRATSHAWKPVTALTDTALERRIRDDEIDILVDLSGHTGSNRLLTFARKPAPVQVTWLGYWETTGLRAIDYILCDSYCVLPGEEKYFIEKPWHLPHTRLCFTLPDGNFSVESLPALSNGFVTFGCFNNLVKMTDRTVAVWAQILKRIPNSRLMLKGASFAEASTCESVIARFAAQGIASNRLLLETRSPRNEYFLTYNRIDIALDPFPFPGGTTSVEGLWMGVPMITLRGNSIISRQGESILHNLGMADWIARSEEDYLELAVKKAGDLASLAKLRAELRSKLTTSPLCDSKLFAKNLNDAFKQMWKQYCDAQ